MRPTLAELHRRGGPAKTRDLFAALRDIGCSVEQSRKSTHYKVVRGNVTIIIVVDHGEVRPVYIARIHNCLLRSEEDGR